MRAWQWVLLGAAVLTRASVAAAYPGISRGQGRRATLRALHERGARPARRLCGRHADGRGGRATHAVRLLDSDPVRRDVQGHLRSVRRTTLARVESVSAPRLHAFYEQDLVMAPRPSKPGKSTKPSGRGFHSRIRPAPDRHYAVSNTISKSIEPVFKEAEGEYRYQILDFDAGASSSRASRSSAIASRRPDSRRSLRSREPA